jgi:KaiC/GvpD/RAD55 family RecA-like ATPase
MNVISNIIISGGDGRMSRRLGLGNSGLDGLIEGGLPEGTSTLLYGPPGSWKHIFCLQFIVEGLQSGDNGIMVISNESVDEARESLSEVGVNFNQLTDDQKSCLRYVDCYSWRTKDVPYPEVLGHVVRSSMDINHIPMAISTATQNLKSDHLRLSVDILSPLLMSSPPQSVYRLASLIIAKLKESKSTSLFILEEGMHDQQTVSSLQQLLDCVILFRNTEKNGFINKEMCISKMKWTRFDQKWISISRDSKTGRITIAQK